MNQRELIHLHWRTGFGATPALIAASTKLSRENNVNLLFDASKKIEPIQIDLSDFGNYFNTPYTKLKKNLGEQKFQKLRQKSRKKVRELNFSWLKKIANSDQVLREKMTLFWANIFVCRDNHILHALKFNNTLRTHALGNFGDFVKAISRSASMLKYLNNNRNFKKKPNENFARELMELFTLGIGNYSETDVKEAARAFTGWNFKPNGEFILRDARHDQNSKIFLGETGNFGGDDIIELIIKQKACAEFICTKMYRYFVNPSVDKEHIRELTDVFYKDYNIETLMRHLFMADWFYEEKNIGVKIKSPVELMVGIHKVVPSVFKKQRQAQYLQKMMGQTLLYPVNVAGWKGDRYWIDSNSLMFRLKLPSLILNNAKISLKPKGEFEDTFDEFYKEKKQRFSVDEKERAYFETHYSKVSFNELKELLVVPRLDYDTREMLEAYQPQNSFQYGVQLMSIPEYQLC
ncbi:MAG: Uncharacterised protein [Formosa sp. Hel1_33_131]|nr:MAG: Uncharacterised protein [Formosa sp. Hel1_33_131]